MASVKFALLSLSVLLLIAGFAGWRFDLGLPFLAYGYYLLAGFGLLAGVLFGKIVGPIIILVSLIPAGWLILTLIFDKDGSWSSANGTILVLTTVAGLAAGSILYAVGSESVLDAFNRSAEQGSRSVVCAACDQYLGTASRFQTPCPRCESNRYKFETG